MGDGTWGQSTGPREKKQGRAGRGSGPGFEDHTHPSQELEGKTKLFAETAGLTHTGIQTLHRWTMLGGPRGSQRMGWNSQAMRAHSDDSRIFQLS